MHIVLVAIGKSDMAYLQFSYHLADIYPFWQVYTVLGVGLLIIACMVGCYILFILKITTAVKIKKLDVNLKDSAMIMTIELAKARAAFNE